MRLGEAHSHDESLFEKFSNELQFESSSSVTGHIYRLSCRNSTVTN